MKGIPLAVVSILLASTMLAADQEQAPARRIASNGKSIESQLRTGDRRVVLELATAPPSWMGPPGGEERIRFLADVSKVVVTLRVENVRPRLVTRQPIGP